MGQMRLVYQFDGQQIHCTVSLFPHGKGQVDLTKINKQLPPIKQKDDKGKEVSVPNPQNLPPVETVWVQASVEELKDFSRKLNKFLSNL